MRIATATAVIMLTLASWTSNCYAFSCSVAATSVNFGAYDVFTLFPLDSSGTITVTCRNPDIKPILATVSLNAGNAGNFAQRQMRSPTGNSLSYNLYTTPSCTTVFGDGSGGSVSQTNTMTKTTPWMITFYGRIPARQNAVPGAYGDVLTVTVTP